MSKQIPNVFDKMSLKYWYKYLLYLAGILLIAALIFGSAFDQNTVVNYCIFIIGISIFLWIADDIFQAIDAYYFEKTDRYNKSAYLETAKTLFVVREIIHFIAFVIWIFVTLRTF